MTIIKPHGFKKSLGPWEFVRDMGNSSHKELIMASGLDANNGILGKTVSIFLHNNCILSVYIRIASMRRF